MRLLFVHKSVEWLGIECLSAVLKEAGHITDLAFEIGLDGTFYFPLRQGTKHNAILKKIRRFNPDLILFSSTTNLFPWVREVSEAIKKKFSVPILVGGVHPTIASEKVIADKNIDMICIGEGEDAIVELVNKMEKKIPVYDTRNIWFKQDSEVIRNEVRPLIPNLDELPFPDKELFYKYGCFTTRLYVMTSRGCPYDCSYCYNTLLKKLYNKDKTSYTRRRSVKSVINELEIYKKQFNAKSIYFYDDIFNYNKQWVIEFAPVYRNRIGLPYYCILRPNLIDKELVGALKNSGCQRVAIGFESGNETVLNEVLNRKMGIKQLREAVAILKENRLKVDLYVMLGLPGETSKEMIDTANEVLALRPDSIFPHIYYPFIGTALMKKAVEMHYIDQNTLERIYSGEGNWTAESIIQHPDKQTAYNIKTILPILNKLPRFAEKYYLEKWILRKHNRVFLFMLKVIGVFFCSEWESTGRLKEQIKMHIIYFIGATKDLRWYRK
ncbi:MAG: B12-binding domain-containing radical SAM protein [Candidatus Omnitrophica bacterium]|nr:B12-binding domain-containing radical SAM protein [Candidatus Omnitrophota bacterium]